MPPCGGWDALSPSLPSSACGSGLAGWTQVQTLGGWQSLAAQVHTSSLLWAEQVAPCWPSTTPPPSQGLWVHGCPPGVWGSGWTPLPPAVLPTAAPPDSWQSVREPGCVTAPDVLRRPPWAPAVPSGNMVSGACPQHSPALEPVCAAGDEEHELCLSPWPCSLSACGLFGRHTFPLSAGAHGHGQACGDLPLVLATRRWGTDPGGETRVL